MKVESGRRSVAAVLSGMGAWLIPAGVCSVGWLAYAGAANSVGLGFTLGAEFLAAIFVLLLTLSLCTLGYPRREAPRLRAPAARRRGWSGSARWKVLVSSEALSYVALAAIVAVGLLNS